MLGPIVPFLIPSVPVTEGLEIRHGCQFLSSLLRALSKLSGGFGRFLPGMVGCLVSKGIVHTDPCSLSFGDLASFHLERCLGAYPVDFAGSWAPPEYWDAHDIALEMSEYPNIWTDGSRKDFSSVGGL